MSEYFLSLQGNVRSRYIDKVKVIDYVDPYTVKKCDCVTDLKNLPVIQLIDIVNYFTLTHSFYTGKQLKAFKSLEAYKYCKAGFIKDIYYIEKSNNFLVLGEVKHSQRMNDPVLKPWIIVLPDGTIDSGHCNCMAGLGEVCSHVAALAFYLFNLHIESTSQTSCTSLLSTWPVPKYSKTIVPQKIKELDWGKKITSYDNVQKLNVPTLQGEDLHEFLKLLEEIEPNAVIFSVMQPYAQTRIPESVQLLPKPLTELYNPDLYVDYSLEELQRIKIQDLNPSQQEAVQKYTIKQRESRLWFQFRAGRVTGSIFKSVCKTSVDLPSLSVLKKICYPLKLTYKTAAMMHGIQNESVALETYKTYTSNIHTNVKIASVGLCIAQESFLAATPDAIIQCDCCGIGVIEIKCPYRMKDSSVDIKKFAELKDSCLLLLNDESCTLDTDHEYFYQIQLQMYVTNTKYCDFMVWSKQQSFVQRILYDESFVHKNVEIARVFFSKVIIPELLVKWYSKSIYSVQPEIWCDCKGIDDGRKMLRCANEDCPVKWFHYQCVIIDKVKITEDTFWFCKTCSLNIFGSI